MPEKEAWHYVYCTCTGTHKCYCAMTMTSDYHLKPGKIDMQLIRVISATLHGVEQPYSSHMVFHVCLTGTGGAYTPIAPSLATSLGYNTL